jgi:hypothetical protein
MADRCLRCGRPQQSDRDWMERTMPAGACRATGDAECEEVRDERYRRMERVCDAAGELVWQVTLLTPEWACIACGGHGSSHMEGCEVEAVRDALLALDGDAR